MDTAAQDDRALVEAVRRGERAGLEGMYRRYADRLYTYARVVTREPEAAADAVHDAFLAAGQRIDQLRDPDRLRPWLYAIVRNECLRQLRERSRSTPLDEAAEPVADAADPGADVNAQQVRELVHAAADALNPGDREVVHLAIRHDLSSADIGAALGVPANHAHARLSRARAQLERALGALLVARGGSRDCPELANLIDGWAGRLTPTLRKRVARHVDDCAVCGLLRREQLNPAALLSAYTAPGFLVVAGSVWSRLADADPTGRVVAGAADGPAGGPTDVTDGSADGGATDVAEGAADVRPDAPGGSPPGGTATPPASDGQVHADLDPSGPVDGVGAPTGTTNGVAVSARTGEPDGQHAPEPGDGPTPAVVAVSDVPRPRAADSAAPGTSAAARDRRRRRRLAVTAGLLALLAVAGAWGLAGRPAGQVAATSGAAADRASGPTTAAAAPAATAPVVTATASDAAPASGTVPASGTADRATPAAGATGPTPSVAPGTRPGPGPGGTAGPTGAPTTAPPTSTPPPARAFTVTASGHVRCGQDTYSLVVRAAGGAAVARAEIRWTPTGDAPSTRAMPVDGASAQVTVGQLRASALTWSVRMTATDGRAAQSPTYQVTDPCLRPG
ncbi:sigma-70 family RNA polymerase sigma factor [Micromonospora sp. WMMD882]|uniref:RNA polymerase sigma factor n=1 Tax=Micromonospora sp. WMMD882 TaxID=3015151 RepID=UPI00248B0DF2|nr:sigma-70 family RNA polymerase sigma factor [Micromonospora sp. WMMD882]WBB81497.1 sigma-70 family RNA polymerase sigma factor [Micromonospora sp. WMMD882]